MTKRTLYCLLATAAVAAASLSACGDMLRSDAANAGRQNAQARQESLAAAKAASQQAAPATPLSGDALVRVLSGKTHVHEYRRNAIDPKPYFIVYEYYRPDGAFIALDSYSRRDPAQVTPGRWRVTGETLCLTEKDGNPQEQCYAVRQESWGRLQYWNVRPGDPFDGLLSSKVDIVRSGLQTPEVTTEFPYGR